MPDTNRIKAYVRDAAGQLVPLAAETLVLEFPGGDSLEIAWDDPHPDDPRPLSVQLWGGRRAGQDARESDAEARSKVRSVALLPSAANLVLVYPYPIGKRDGRDGRDAMGGPQVDEAPSPAVGST